MLCFAPGVWAAPLQEALPSDARAAYTEGRAEYAANDFAAALASFGRAFELSPDPRLLWNMAACERKLAHSARAIALIDRYVATGGALLTEDDRREAARWRAALAKNVAAVTITTEPAGVEVAVDDAPIGTTPFAAPIVVDGGARRVRFSRRGFRTVVRVEQVAPGTAVAWGATLERIRVRLVTPP
jgi:hypothetical protein